METKTNVDSNRSIKDIIRNLIINERYSSHNFLENCLRYVINYPSIAHRLIESEINKISKSWQDETEQQQLLEKEVKQITDDIKQCQ